jgi:magnesium-transporting ATPase (P-type)
MVTQMIEDQRSLIFEFMKALCLCHEVVTEQKDINSPIKYQGPSPDEIALVVAAADVGFVLQSAHEEKVIVNFINGQLAYDYDEEIEEEKDAGSKVEQDIAPGDIELELGFERNRHGVHYGPGVHHFQIKRRMQFTSDRKRMSVLVKDPTNGHFKLFIKGADTTIEERLDPDDNDAELVNQARNFALQASKRGLRTLYVAMKLLDP